MDNKGWIKLYRCLLGKAVWKNATPGQKVVLITILMLANHKDNEWEWEGKKFTCQPGQFITSLSRLSKASGVSLQTVRSSLARFEKYDFSTRKATGRGTLITICNWKKYQGKEDGTQHTPQQSPNKVPTTNKNDMNEEKKKHTAKPDDFAGHAGEAYRTKKGRKLTGSALEDFLQFWTAFSYKRGKAEAADAWLELNLSRETIDKIITGAEREAATRTERVKLGQTPKMAQGWLSGRRWEDEQEQAGSSQNCEACDYRHRSQCDKNGPCDAFRPFSEGVVA